MHPLIGPSVFAKAFAKAAEMFFWEQENKKKLKDNEDFVFTRCKMGNAGCDSCDPPFSGLHSMIIDLTSKVVTVRAVLR